MLGCGTTGTWGTTAGVVPEAAGIAGGAAHWLAVPSQNFGGDAGSPGRSIRATTVVSPGRRWTAWFSMEAPSPVAQARAAVSGVAVGVARQVDRGLRVEAVTPEPPAGIPERVDVGDHDRVHGLAVGLVAHLLELGDAVPDHRLLGGEPAAG